MRATTHLRAIASHAAPPALAASLVVLLGASAAPAQAAYAPALSVQVAPATQGAAPAITSTITQAAGETANKTVKVYFPRGYSANLGEMLQICTPDQEKANTCPDASRMGTAAAQASVLGLPQDLSGNVYFGGVSNAGFKLIVYLSNPVLGTQTLEGLSNILPDGTVETVFDNLPNVLTTSFTLRLEGGGRSLLINPTVCGSFPFSAKFISQNGETAQATAAPVTITGCPPPLSAAVISGLSLRPASVRAGHRSTLRFSLDRPARVRVSIQRIAGRARIRRITIDASAGPNTIANVARGLAPGRYRIKATTVGDPAGATSAGATLTVRSRGH